MLKKVLILFWLILGLVFTYLLGTWIYVVEIKDIATDKGAAYSSMFGWMATVFAGGVAAYLFNDWKEQHNKNIDTIYYQEAITLLKDVSSNINEIKRTIPELTFNQEDRSDIVASIYKNKITSYLNNLSKFQNTILFIDLVEKNNNLENIIFTPFIKAARSRILNEDLDISVLERMIFKDIITHISKESNFHGNLIKENITPMLQYLNNKIKA
ncbi:hypothetical protein FW754_15355 [Acinetobacter sp. 1207_04]